MAKKTKKPKPLYPTAGEQKKIPAEQIEHIAPNLRALAIPIDQLRVDPKNARVHSKANLAAISHSLAAVGQQKPIVVSRDGTVVAGNGLLQAASELGWEYIAGQVTDLTAQRLRAYAIADNRTSDLSSFDNEILAKQLAEINKSSKDLIAITGYDEKQLVRFLAEIGQGNLPDAEIPEVFAVQAECKNENQQKKLFNQLKKEGYKVKCLVI